MEEEEEERRKRRWPWAFGAPMPWPGTGRPLPPCGRKAGPARALGRLQDALHQTPPFPTAGKESGSFIWSNTRVQSPPGEGASIPSPIPPCHRTDSPGRSRITQPGKPGQSQLRQVPKGLSRRWESRSDAAAPPQHLPLAPRATDTTRVAHECKAEQRSCAGTGGHGSQQPRPRGTSACSARPSLGLCKDTPAERAKNCSFPSQPSPRMSEEGAVVSPALRAWLEPAQIRQRLPIFPGNIHHCC